MKRQNQAIQNFWDHMLQLDSSGGKAVCALNQSVYVYIYIKKRKKKERKKRKKLTFTL